MFQPQALRLFVCLQPRCYVKAAPAVRGSGLRLSAAPTEAAACSGLTANEASRRCRKAHASPGGRCRSAAIRGLYSSELASRLRTCVPAGADGGRCRAGSGEAEGRGEKTSRVRRKAVCAGSAIHRTILCPNGSLIV